MKPEIKNESAPKSAYALLKKRFEKSAHLSHAAHMLSNDAETRMPKGSAQDRIAQIVTLYETVHDILTAPDTGELLARANDNEAANLLAEDRRNLELMQRIWLHKTALPADLNREYERLNAEGRQRHIDHYKSGNWNEVRDWYVHCFKIAREVGEVKAEKLALASPYEALLDQFSPGLKQSTIEQEFAKLETALTEMIPAALEKQSRETAPLPLHGPFPAEQQMELNRWAAGLAGFDYNKGRLDLITGHPSSGGSPDDSRLTTRCDEGDFTGSFYASVHEAGHGMYEQALPADWRYQPAGRALGMSVHESQSMIIEYQACMTHEFLKLLSEKARAVFNRPDDPSLSAENLQKTMWHAEPSYIRVEADELTYPAHIILRFNIEKGIIEGRLDAKDLPDIWAAEMQRLLGITPPDNAQGCMQDIHWPTGAQGYFPAYTIGAMTAAQLIAKAKKDIPGLLTNIGNGNFAPLREWLRTNIHSRGSLVDSDTLLRDATGEGLNAAHYMAHLKERYL